MRRKPPPSFPAALHAVRIENRAARAARATRRRARALLDAARVEALGYTRLRDAILICLALGGPAGDDDEPSPGRY